MHNSIQRVHVVLFVSSLGLAGCTDTSKSSVQSEPPKAATSVTTTEPQDDSPQEAAFRDCAGRVPFKTPKAGQFAHKRSKLIAKVGDHAHSAQDVLVTPDAAMTVAGKFAYGRVSKDLEDEPVDLYLGDCETWKPLATTRSDDDGRIAYTIEKQDQPGLGVFDIKQVVQGDATLTSSRLTVAPAGSRLIVFDIDGTLTIGDKELAKEMADEFWEGLRSGENPPEPYPGAAALTKAWAAKGYLVVYVTGRPYWLAELTRTWLAKQKCAPGHLHTTDRNRDARPSKGGVGEFKAAYLQSLKDQGFVIDYIYGNTESDVFAYAKAGIDPSKTYIIGEFGGIKGTNALKGGYTEHLKWVATQPNIEQPFVMQP
jgi:phosphatidate phosphatase PAH1